MFVAHVLAAGATDLLRSSRVDHRAGVPRSRVSGAKESRPAFDEMMKAAKRRRMLAIVVQHHDSHNPKLAREARSRAARHNRALKRIKLQFLAVFYANLTHGL